MKYLIEELEIQSVMYGEPVKIYITCEIEITAWNHEPAVAGCGHEAYRGPEPSYSESYTATDFEIIDNLGILVDGDGIEEDLEIPEKPETVKELLTRSFVHNLINEKADWDDINERLTESMQ